MAYWAENDALTEWKYLGEFFRHPDRTVSNIEVANIFSLGGDRWVLIVSVPGSVHYFVGGIDEERWRFDFDKRGILDAGNFYATNGLIAPDGRILLWAWVRGFRPGRGWTGSLTAPRVLSLGPDGDLRQQPAKELRRLRGNAVHLENVALTDEGVVIEGLRGDALEIMAEFEPGTAPEFGLRLRCSNQGMRGMPIAIRENSLHIGDRQIELDFAERTCLKLHVLLDRSILEIFINDGRQAVTHIFSPEAADRNVQVFALGGDAKLTRFNAWVLSESTPEMQTSLGNGSAWK